MFVATIVGHHHISRFEMLVDVLLEAIKVSICKGLISAYEIGDDSSRRGNGFTRNGDTRDARNGRSCTLPFSTRLIGRFLVLLRRRYSRPHGFTSRHGGKVG